MKIQVRKLFERITSEIQNKGKKTNVYFIEKRSNNYIKGELRISNWRAYIYLDDDLLIKFQTVENRKNQIEQNLDNRYKNSWLSSFEDVIHAKNGNHLVQLNSICSGFFGPFFNYTRTSQSYNVYTSLYIDINEIFDLSIEHSQLNNNIEIYLGEIKLISLDSLSMLIPVDKEIINSSKNNVQEEDYQQKNNFQTSDFNNKNIDNESDFEQIDDKERFNLKSLSINNFVQFAENTISFSPNINIIIGKNDTGKTTLLKLLYAVSKTTQVFNEQQFNKQTETFRTILNRKLGNVFNCRLEKIVQIQKEEMSANFLLNCFTNDGNIKIGISKNTVNSQIDDILDIQKNPDIVNAFNSIFIPAKEILTIKGAILHPITKQFFDDTYVDLAEQIILPDIDSSKIGYDYKRISGQIERDIINGEFNFKSKENVYLFKKEGNEFEMEMTAEGTKQLGIFSILIKKGFLRNNTILFIDEPDTNLNPFAIRMLCKNIVELSKAGVQIFLTTHNYFVLHELHNLSRIYKELPFRCFSLYSFNKSINIEQYDLIKGIPDNAIISESIEMFNNKMKLDINYLNQ